MSDAKAAARRRAAARRAGAHDAARGARAAAHLSSFLGAYAGRVLAGYVPIRTEIDPGPVLAAWDGPIGLPVVKGPGLPLRFRRWQTGEALEPGAYGVPVPVKGKRIVPDILIVPLLAFDDRGFRLGYGGGFYDRTLAALRREGDCLAVGFAYAAQREGDLPVEPTDAPLDVIVTERGVSRYWHPAGRDVRV